MFFCLGLFTKRNIYDCVFLFFLELFCCVRTDVNCFVEFVCFHIFGYFFFDDFDVVAGRRCNEDACNNFCVLFLGLYCNESLHVM